MQIQLATTIYALSETQRTSQQLEDAAAGLEAAIEALDKIAAHPRTPYPKHDVEQRANMARNTQRKQLERAIASQKEYEEKNKEKLLAAVEQRQAELRRREEQRLEVLRQEKERQEKIRKEREEIQARDRQLTEQRAEEDKARAAAEMTTDSETGEKVKRKRKAPKATGETRPKGRSRKKNDDEGDDDESEEERQPKKKRRLAKKENTKYKSAEIVVDSDEEENEDALERAEREMANEDTPDSDGEDARKATDSDQMDVDDAGDDDEDEEAAAPTRQQSKRTRRSRVVDEGDDEDEDEEAAAPQEDDEAAQSPPQDEEEAPVADTSMADPEDEDDE